MTFTVILSLLLPPCRESKALGSKIRNYPHHFWKDQQKICRTFDFEKQGLTELKKFRKRPCNVKWLFQILQFFVYFYGSASEALHFDNFEKFVKSMTTCLSKGKVLIGFGFEMQSCIYYLMHLKINFPI